MKDLEKFLDYSLLDELFKTRQEKFAYNVIRKSEEYKKFQNETEDKLMSILNYISGEHYKKVEEEINDILYYNFLGLSEFWNKNYYKLGFFDGLNAKKELEEVNNG